MTRRVTRKRIPKGPAGVLVQYAEEPEGRVGGASGREQSAWRIAALM